MRSMRCVRLMLRHHHAVAVLVNGEPHKVFAARQLNLGVLLGLGFQSGCVARGVLAQIGHGRAEVFDQRVEDVAQGLQVNGLAQHVEKTRQVVRPRDVADLGDAEDGTQSGIAVQLGQAVVEPDVTAQDAEHDHAPQHTDRVIVATVAARLTAAARELGANELMLSTLLPSFDDRKRSLELIAAATA